MSLRSASLLAMIGTVLLAVVLLLDLIRDIVGVARDIVPAMVLLRSLLYTFIGLTLAIFFVVFHKRNS